MDGTLTEGSFVLDLAAELGISDQLKTFFGNHELDPQFRARKIAQLLKGAPQEAFEKVASSVQLKPQAREVIIELKKRGFQVGLITDSYFVASEVIRKRVFADFSVAHFLHFHNGVTNGDLSFSPWMKWPQGCKKHLICKSNFIRHVNHRTQKKNIRVYSVGNGENDICMFLKSKFSFAIYPQSSHVVSNAHLEVSCLSEVLESIFPIQKTGA
jgi:phosphoserine phosphatase